MIVRHVVAVSNDVARYLVRIPLKETSGLKREVKQSPSGGAAVGGAPDQEIRIPLLDPQLRQAVVDE